MHYVKRGITFCSSFCSAQSDEQVPEANRPLVRAMDDTSSNSTLERSVSMPQLHCSYGSTLAGTASGLPSFSSLALAEAPLSLSLHHELNVPFTSVTTPSNSSTSASASSAEHSLSSATVSTSVSFSEIASTAPSVSTPVNPPISDDEPPTYKHNQIIAIHECCENGTAEELRKLIEAIPLEFRAEIINHLDSLSVYTPMQHAAFKGHAKQINVLLSYKADYQYDSDGGLELLSCAAGGGNRATIELVIGLVGVTAIDRDIPITALLPAES